LPVGLWHLPLLQGLLIVNSQRKLVLPGDGPEARQSLVAIDDGDLMLNIGWLLGQNKIKLTISQNLLDINPLMNNQIVPGHSVMEGGYGENKALEGIGLPTLCGNRRAQPRRMEL
jgi:hypothetical protein